MQLESDIHLKDDLGGPMSVKFKEGKNFNDLVVAHVENYNPDRFEVIAMRVYYGKETIVTVYALDKDRQEGTNFKPEKMPVRKFKLTNVRIPDLLPYIDECNFTLTSGQYPLEEMEVVNK